MPRAADYNPDAHVAVSIDITQRLLAVINGKVPSGEDAQQLLRDSYGTIMALHAQNEGLNAEVKRAQQAALSARADALVDTHTLRIIRGILAPESGSDY